MKVDPFVGLDPLQKDSAQPFTFRKGPAAPPSVSESLTLPFPPPKPVAKVVKPKPKPLLVVRTQPRGKDGLIGAVTATFNQAMVPVASLQTLAALDPPMEIAPKVPGRFRWLGSQTVAFEPEGRMPFGTDYVARIAAGTRSPAGSVLEKEVRWTFSTPRPRVVSSLPARYGRQTKPDTALAFLFNQKVSEKQIFNYLKLNKKGREAFDPVPPDQWAKLPYIGATVATWDPTRTVVIRPRQAFALDARQEVKIMAGLRGEGPRATTRDWIHPFYTYGPLKVQSIRCSNSRCNPSSGFRLVFNNPLTTSEFAKFVTVDPAPTDLEVSGSGRWIHLSGSFKPRSSVTVAVSPGVVDIHEQKLAVGERKTLQTGDIHPALGFAAQGYAVLELKGNRQAPLHVASVTKARMRLVRVRREQLNKVIALARYSYDDNGRRDPLAGIKGLVKTRQLRTRVAINGRARLGLSTDEGLGRGKPGVLYIELKADQLKRYSKWANPYRGLVVSVTDIGLMARYDHDIIVAMATSLSTGKALGGVGLELRGRDGKVLWTGKAGADGVAQIPGRRAHKERGPYTLWAQKGKDVAFALLNGSGAGSHGCYSYNSYGYAPAKKRLKLFIFSDRDPYRPGETVHLRGVVRLEDTTPTGGIGRADRVQKVDLRVTSPRGRKILEKQKVEVSKSGAFSVKLDVPAEADLGRYSVYVSTAEGNGYGSFQVQAYRAPEFAVKVTSADEPLFFGDTLRSTVQADYLFGAPMSGAAVRWTARRAGASFKPPKNQGFFFGERLPFYLGWAYRSGLRGGRHGGYFESRGAAGKLVEQGNGVLDAGGKLAVELELSPMEEKPPYKPAALTFEAQVEDQNRQSIANRKTITVHPAAVYVGLRPKKTVVKAGEPLAVDAVLANLDGSRVAGTALTLQALRIKNSSKPVQKNGVWSYQWQTSEVQVDSCQLTTASDPAACDLTLPKAGAYLVRAETKDAKGRLARSTIRVYAHGPGYVPWRLKNQSQIELVADRESYEPGDTAKILIKSPLANSLGFLTFSRSGMIKHRVLSMQGNAQVIEVPIPKEAVPELWVGVALSRGRIKDKKLGKAAQDLGRPTFAHGAIRLPVSLKQKTITVIATPSAEAVRPSGEFSLKLKTIDVAGKPVQGELAVMVVDEGVLSLLNYKTPDPLKFFWGSRQAETALQDNRDVLLKREIDLKKVQQPRGRRGNGGVQRRVRMLDSMVLGGAAQPSAAPMGSAAVGDAADNGGVLGLLKTADKRESKGAAPRIRSRSLFATTAYVNPSVLTDAAGEARLTITMPDNLSTFRIMVVALDSQVADRFGHGEAQIKVRKPLLLRPSLPRFLSVGDRFEAAVMVHNETNAAAEADVLVRGRNVAVNGAARKRVTIEAHRAVEVRFNLAPQTPGPARIQFAAVLGGKETDAVEKQLPVLLPATTEAFATYGMTDGSIAQPVAPPDDALPGYGGLDVALSSTALNGLEDAVRYLVDYPYECTEQTASRILPIFALKDILADFSIGKLADLKRQQALARAGVRKLLSSQRYDGGWGSWSGSRISWPYLTAYAVFTLMRAKENGHEVNENKLNRAARFLKRLLDYPRREFGEQYQYATQMLSAWALSELGKHQNRHFSRLYGLRHKVPLFARAMLMQALYRAEQNSPRVKEMMRELQNAATETASAVHFAEVKTESLRLLMHSEDRTDAIVLYALLQVAPDDPLLPKVARGLIQARVKGRWSTTQANAYALTALARYYHEVEKVVPDYVAQLWLGQDGYLGQSTFKGRQLRVVRQSVPLAALQSAGRSDLVLAKKGPGKLYYRVGLRYAPKDLLLSPEEQGFAVSRVYEPIEGNKQSVSQAKDGSWRIKAGSTVRVRVTVVVPSQRYFVAVMDPLPAGLEPVNMAFATSARSRLGNQLKKKAYDFHSWYALFAFDHKEMRDESVVLFSDRLPAGVYEYTYLARATTLGRFVVAPSKAEEMYRPETFGRSGTTFVEIK